MRKTLGTSLFERHNLGPYHIITHTSRLAFRNHYSSLWRGHATWSNIHLFPFRLVWIFFVFFRDDRTKSSTLFELDCDLSRDDFSPAKLCFSAALFSPSNAAILDSSWESIPISDGFISYRQTMASPSTSTVATPTEDAAVVDAYPAA